MARHERAVASHETLWHRTVRWLRAARAYLQSDGIVPWLLNILLAFLIIKLIVFPSLGLLFGSELPVVAVMSGSMEHRPADGVVCGRTMPADYDKSLDAYWNECGGWYEGRGITKAQFATFSLNGGFNKGDIMVIIGPTRGAIAVGDIIVFQSREPYPIIHRVIAIHDTPAGRYYETKGDHNPAQIVAYYVMDGRGNASPCEQGGKPASCATGSLVTATTPGAIELLDETHVAQETIVGRAVGRIPVLGWVKIWFSTAVNWAIGRPTA